MAVGVLALVAITVDAFVLRPARLTDTGQPITGLFDAHLVTTDYLRLVVGLWGLESLVLVFAAWLLGGLARLRGLLPATLAAITGGTVAMASADLGVGAGAAAVTGLAALLVILAVEGPAAVAAAARELRVTLVGGRRPAGRDRRRPDRRAPGPDRERRRVRRRHRHGELRGADRRWG